MNQTNLQTVPIHSATLPWARLSQPHGYRFDGDTVHLQARFTILDSAAHQRAWALQLWACPSAPGSPGALNGHIVAEVALPPMSEVADEIEHVDMTAFACPPLGAGEHVMVLVLATGRPGRFDEVHDFSVYPRRQLFLQPRMRGMVGYRIEGDRVRLSVERIENPRDAANRSGTLALELWALPAPYGGGPFHGPRLAGVVIGQLCGQTELISIDFDLPFSSPPSGVWHFVLMLCEWTSAGYLARDFTNFINPVTYGLSPAATPAKPGDLIAAEGAPIAPRLPAKPAPVALLQEMAPKSPVHPAAAPAMPNASGPDKPEPVAFAQPKAVAGVARPVSVNTGSEEELGAVEGLSPKLARALMKQRPFASLEELRRVKGISAGLLARIRSQLKV
jgi:Helix-hairpin-helix motif